MPHQEKICTTLDMSRFPPALFSISLNPITRSPSGLSAVLRKGEATMFTSCRLSLLSSSSIGKKHVLVGNSEFSRNCWFITDKGGLQAIASGRDSGDLELADRISDSPFYRVPDDDIGEANRFAVGGIFLQIPFIEYVCWACIICKPVNIKSKRKINFLVIFDSCYGYKGI